jgi:hypothetical protein
MANRSVNTFQKGENMKVMTGIVSSAVIACSAAAQSTGGGQPAAAPVSVTPAPPAQADGPPSSMFSWSQFGFNENISFFNLSDGNITEFSQEFTWAPKDDFKLRFVLPVYVNDGHAGTGMSAVGFTYTLKEMPLKFISAVDLGVDIKMPTSSAGFGGDSVNPVIRLGAFGETGFDKLYWKGSFDYEWNTDQDFIPVFGGLVSENILHASGGLSYALTDKFNIEANYNLWSLDGSGTINTIGPGLSYKLCSNADLSFACDIPFAESSVDDLDLVVRFGLNVKF